MAIASFTVDVVGGFPVSYPTTATITNTSTGSFDRYQWKITCSSGQILTYFNTNPNPVIGIAEGDLPIKIDLNIWTFDSSASINPFSDAVVQSGHQGAGASAPPSDQNARSYVNWQEVEDGVDETPPFGSTQLNMWTVNTYSGSAMRYKNKQTSYSTDLSAYDPALIMQCNLEIVLLAGEDRAGEVKCTEGIQGSGSILGTKVINDDVIPGTSYVIADFQKFVGDTAIWQLSDTSFASMEDDHGWEINTLTIRFDYGHDGDNDTQILNQNGMGNGLHIDFVGTPREGVSPMDVQFTDTSLTDFVSWRWWFGDGQTSIEEHPENTYTID